MLVAIAIRAALTRIRCLHSTAWHMVMSADFYAHLRTHKSRTMTPTHGWFTPIVIYTCNK